MAIQALFSEADENPPLLSRVLSRLSKDDGTISCTSREGEESDVAASGDANTTTTKTTTTVDVNAPGSSFAPTQQQPARSSSSSKPRTDTADVAVAGGDGDGVGGGGVGGAIPAVGAAAGGGKGGGSFARRLQQKEEEEDAFAQNLIDAAIVVEREIANTLEQMVSTGTRACAGRSCGSW